MRAVHCSNHCRACGSHFSSEQAFDLHRQFEEGHDGDWDRRVCAEPLDIRDRRGNLRLAARSQDGVCAISVPAEPKLGVTVWTMASSMDSHRAMRLRSLAS